MTARTTRPLTARRHMAPTGYARVWLVAWLALAAGLIGRTLWHSSDDRPVAVASSSSTVHEGLLDEGLLSGVSYRPAERLRRTFKPIEELRVGERVLADNPDEASPAQTAVDPSTWRRLTLYAEETWPDGTLDTIHIQTLQPPAWVERFGASVGAEVPPPLDLVEMGLPEDLLTRVVKNEPCPPLQPPLAGDDPGRLVLTTVNHLNPDVWELTCEPIRGPPAASTDGVSDGASAEHTLRPTGFHKFYSETRSDWVSTNELESGEVIRGRGEPLRVTRAWPQPGVERVYNLTVEGEHVYYVGELAALAHNTCPGETLTNAVDGAISHNRTALSLFDLRSSAGFSGAYNTRTGQFAALPSGSTVLRGGRTPTSLVARRGGHVPALRALDDLSPTSYDDAVGFTLLFNRRGEAVVAFNSGGLNQKHPFQLVPDNLRPEIISALQESLGVEVKSLGNLRPN